MNTIIKDIIDFKARGGDSMLRENNKEKVTVEINVNTNKANQFINDLVNLLNKYGLDGINICNESIIQINLLDFMEYRVTPVNIRQAIQTNSMSLADNKLDTIINNNKERMN